MESSTARAEDQDQTKKRSVVIVDMPIEFINREVLKNHFEKFGTVERVACSVSKKYAVLHFSTPEEAQNAEHNGTIIREGAPPLKIYNRAIDSGNISRRALAPPNPQQPSRMVTRRKIVRNFSGVPSSPGMIQPQSTMSDSKESPALAPVSQDESSAPRIASTSKFQQAPLRSSIKISRPSPYLRKRSSYGDRGGKVPTGTGSYVPRNPFALPPRAMLSIDRRRRTTEVPAATSVSKLRERNADTTDGRSRQLIVAESAVGSSVQSNEGPDDSAEIPLPDEDQTEAEEEPFQSQASSGTEQQEKLETEEDNTVAPPNVDGDESTEDAAFNDDSNWEPKNSESNLNQDQDALDEAETDTQDTADATTEEEGEILDENEDEDDYGEQEEDGDDDGNGDVYESPLKRMEKAGSTTTSASKSSSGGAFSFKLAQSKATTSSSFTLPFSSPFSFGDTPKPFSSASFGSQFSVPTSSIFPGSSTTSATPSQSVKPVEKEKEMPKSFGGSQLETKKETFGLETSLSSSSSLEPEKPKPFSFGMFSNFGGNSASANRSSSPSNTSKPASIEAKPSKFSISKPIPVSGVQVTLSSSLSTTAPPQSSSSSVERLPLNVVAPKIMKKQSPISQPTIKERDGPNPLLLTFNPDTPESQELFSKRSNTVEERYRILEARDKIIRARIPKTKVNVEHATKLIGTCPDMCPEKERYMRQFQRQLVSYEILPGQDVVVDHQKAIKAYSRSSADQEEPLPHELRPGPTLDFTMHYLLHFIVPFGDDPDENLSDWYNFLWDRTRSIRKDITQQQIIDLTAVSLYEKCARFHIHCASRLCELDVHSFDPKLNDENLVKCIQSLEHLYEDLRRKQVNCPNEPEFRAYQIMMNLNEGDALIQAQQLPTWILNSMEVQTALKLHHSMYMKNFVAFFKTVESLPYMMSCILHRYFFQVRSLALRCFVKAHCTLPKYETALPMSTLQRMLGYGPTGALSFSYLCEAHGIHCDVEEKKVILKRKLFYLPEFPSIYRENHLIDSKLRTTVAEAINGGPLPEIDFANRIPHSSFNENGQLIAGDIVGGVSNENHPPSAAFIPPEISSANKSVSKPGFGLFGAGAATQSSFSFGGSVFQQPKKVATPPPQTSNKPTKQIEAVCQAATRRIIEESVQDDVAQLSQARLEEARIMQERAERRRQDEEIANRVASEFFVKIMASQTESIVRAASATKLRNMRIAEEVARSTASTLLDESVVVNISISARTELIISKEYYHRLLMSLRKIFQRVRARFALEKWIRFWKAKKMEREKEEEKRREELWNFPAINSYTLSTKDVFKTFCGRSSVQPSLNKVELLKKSPEDTFTIFNTRPKRKSDGDTSEFEASSGVAPRKLPRLSSGGNIRIPTEQNYEKMKELWDFPVIDSYSRTNRQVLQAFCGSSHSANTLISPKMSALGSKASTSFFGNRNHESPGNDSSYIRRRNVQPTTNGRLGQEIRTKASESTSDFLKNVRDFLSQVKEETRNIKLEPYIQEVEEFKKKCPEVAVYMEGRDTRESHMDTLNSDESEDSSSEWIETYDGRPQSILSGIFMEEDNLLSRIRSFAKEVKQEKQRTWNTDTFLNDIDLSMA